MPLVRLTLAAVAAICVPALAYAQASINGVVKDTSGAVLPGVTVEAASPALIEKVRSAVTDSGGQYHVENLRPGTYTLTFTLAGFSTVKREGIELTGSFTATVNADMKVGAVAETIIVTGETPVVDVVNAKQQQTVSAARRSRRFRRRACITASRRSCRACRVSGSQDVGGLAGPVTVTFNMRGGPGNEGRLTLDGLSLGASLNGTGVSYTVADVPNAQEIIVHDGRRPGRIEVGGPAMNLVPRQGGNTFSGSLFGNWANDSLQTQQLHRRDQGRRPQRAEPDAEDLGLERRRSAARFAKDKLWFFAADALSGQSQARRGHVRQPQRRRPERKWTYVADDLAVARRRDVEELQRAR